MGGINRNVAEHVTVLPVAMKTSVSMRSLAEVLLNHWAPALSGDIYQKMGVLFLTKTINNLINNAMTKV